LKTQINLPSDKLIVENIKERTKFFNYLFSDIKYFISGSFLMNTVFSKSADYSDIDIYFPSKQDYTTALKILEKEANFTLSMQTKYAATYRCSTTNVFLQLVKKNVKSIKHLACSHDFANCSLAVDINANSIFISKKAVQAWENNVLEYNFSPLLKKGFDSLKFCNQLNLFYMRLIKYTSRYKLSLSDNLKEKIKKILLIHQQHLSKIFTRRIKFCNDYANIYHTSKYSQMTLHYRIKKML
jgi:hypothetical protein